MFPKNMRLSDVIMESDNLGGEARVGAKMKELVKEVGWVGRHSDT